MKATPEIVQMMLQIVEWVPQLKGCEPGDVRAYCELVHRYTPTMASEPALAGPVIWNCLKMGGFTITAWNELLDTERTMVMAKRHATRHEPVIAVQGQVRSIDIDAIEWIVNDSGELGVKIGTTFAFLYKGHSLDYGKGEDEGGVPLHDDGTPRLWRHVGKREFGECCHPRTMPEDGQKGRYTVGEGWRPLGQDAPRVMYDVDFVGRK
jgi:hypothetical protein